MTEVLLKELSSADIDWIVTTGHQREIADETILIQEGQNTNEVHILLDGMLAIIAQRVDNNPLARAYAAIDGGDISGWEVTRLSSGEVVGEIPFVSTYVTSSTIKAVNKSLVVSLPVDKLALKLQQDVAFSARFYRAIAIMFSDRLQNIIKRFGRNNIALGQPLKNVLFVLGELHDSDIDWIMACGSQQKIATDTVIIQQSGTVDALYILLDGIMSLSIAVDERNPLTRAFAAIEEKEISGREIARVSKGEIIGETPFIDGRLPAATVTTLEECLVLLIPRQILAAKLQQDVGFASRFYRVIATLLANRSQGMLSRLGYGKRVYTRGESLNRNVQYEDELDFTTLDKMALAGQRFDWMRKQLKVN
jgi:bacteriocin-type transport-associated protein